MEWPKFFRIVNVALIWGVGGSGALQAENRLEMNTLSMETDSGKQLGFAAVSEEMKDFFSSQKKFVYQILGQLGVAKNSLPPEIRRDIDQLQTTNFKAFEVFSQGLDQVDHGQFATAEVLFAQAVSLDPQFRMAEVMRAAMPSINLIPASSQAVGGRLGMASLQNGVGQPLPKGMGPSFPGGPPGNQGNPGERPGGNLPGGGMMPQGQPFSPGGKGVNLPGQPAGPGMMMAEGQQFVPGGEGANLPGQPVGPGMMMAGGQQFVPVGEGANLPGQPVGPGMMMAGGQFVPGGEGANLLLQPAGSGMTPPEGQFAPGSDLLSQPVGFGAVLLEGPSAPGGGGTGLPLRVDGSGVTENPERLSGSGVTTSGVMDGRGPGGQVGDLRGVDGPGKAQISVDAAIHSMWVEAMEDGGIRDARVMKPQELFRGGPSSMAGQPGDGHVLVSMVGFSEKGQFGPSSERKALAPNGGYQQEGEGRGKVDPSRSQLGGSSRGGDVSSGPNKPPPGESRAGLDPNKPSSGGGGANFDPNRPPPGEGGVSFGLNNPPPPGVNPNPINPPPSGEMGPPPLNNRDPVVNNQNFAQEWGARMESSIPDGSTQGEVRAYFSGSSGQSPVVTEKITEIASRSGVYGVAASGTMNARISDQGNTFSVDNVNTNTSGTVNFNNNSINLSMSGAVTNAYDVKFSGNGQIKANGSFQLSPTDLTTATITKGDAPPVPMDRRQLGGAVSGPSGDAALIGGFAGDSQANKLAVWGTFKTPLKQQ